jgi:ELWxxDGT repeat protein
MTNKILFAAMLLFSCNLFALELTVSGFNYTPITFTAQDEETIASIKDEIAEQVNIKSSNQRLMLGDIELHSHRTLKDYDILADTNLTLEFKPQVLSDSKDTVLLYDLHQDIQSVKITKDAELQNFHSDGENVLFTYNSENGNELGSYTPSSTAVLSHDINPGAGNSFPAGFMSFNDKMYFSANNINTGRELYYFDTASKAAVLVADINPNGDSLITPEANNPNIYDHKPYVAKSYKTFKNHLYFVANNGVSGHELWALDSSNTPVIVEDLFEGSSSSNPRYFNTTGEYLYFIVDAENGDSLIRLQGDSQQIEIIATYPEITHLTTTVENAFFVTKNAQGVEALYQFDSEQNTVVAVIDPTSNLINTFSEFDSLVAVKNSVYFNAKSTTLSDFYQQTTFWQFDAEASVTKRFGVIPISQAQVFGVFNDKLFFTQLDGYDSAPEVFYHLNSVLIADDKTATTIRSYQFSIARGGYRVKYAKQHDGTLYYSATYGNTEHLLVKVSLATNERTVLLSPPYPKGEVIGAFNSLAFVDDKIYYSITAYAAEGYGDFLESYDVSAGELETIKKFNQSVMESHSYNIGIIVPTSKTHHFNHNSYFIKNNKLTSYNEKLDQFRQLSSKNFNKILGGYDNNVYLLDYSRIWLFSIVDNSLTEIHTGLKEARWLGSDEHRVVLNTDSGRLGGWGTPYEFEYSLLNTQDGSLKVMGRFSYLYTNFVFTSDTIYIGAGLLYQYKNDTLEVALPGVTVLHPVLIGDFIYFIHKEGYKYVHARFNIKNAEYEALEVIYEASDFIYLLNISGSPSSYFSNQLKLISHENSLFYCAYKDNELKLISYAINDNKSRALGSLNSTSSEYYKESCSTLVSHDRLYVGTKSLNWVFDDELMQINDVKGALSIHQGHLILNSNHQLYKFNESAEKFEAYLDDLFQYNWKSFINYPLHVPINYYSEMMTSTGFFTASELWLENEEINGEYTYIGGNRAPSISGVPQAKVKKGDYSKFIPSGFDMDGQQLIYSIENKPDWLMFDVETGILSGVPTTDAQDTKGVILSVSDGHVTESLAPFDITITYAPPSAIADIASLNANGIVHIDVLQNDTDPQNSVLTISAATATSGEVEVVNGMLRYTAKAYFVGSDVITYTIENEYGLSASGEVQVTVVAVAPITTVDAASLNANSDIQIDVLQNDTDPQNSVLTITAATATSGEVEVVNGMLRYTAKAYFVGSDVITYTIENEFGLSASAEVQVTVKAVEEVVTEDKKSSGSVYLMLLMLCSFVLFNRRSRL